MPSHVILGDSDIASQVLLDQLGTSLLCPGSAKELLAAMTARGRIAVRKSPDLCQAGRRGRPSLLGRAAAAPSSSAEGADELWVFYFPVLGSSCQGLELFESD